MNTHTECYSYAERTDAEGYARSMIAVDLKPPNFSRLAEFCNVAIKPPKKITVSRKTAEKNRLLAAENMCA